MNSVRGFTLIELLVVITIIAIISSIGMVMYQQGQKGAKDTRRKQDLRSIQAALSIYYQKNDRYPCSDNTNSGVGSSNGWQTSTSDSWIDDKGSSCSSQLTTTAFNTSYINLLPKDPQNTSGLPWAASSNYTYSYWSGTVTGSGCPSGVAQYYILAAKLENSQDPETSGNKTYNFCNGQNITSVIPGGPDTGKLFLVTSQD
ncbi:type II secretion system protein [Candidatus Daviesbacteria bacterium]|nr:type II secretion system protein [Candidatus Daviesbacteria bacterium]